VSVPDVRANVRALSGGQRQAVAVARTVIGGGRLIVMDEPTSMLGAREAERVLDLVGELRSNGHAVLLVSHNLEGVFTVADRIVVLRHGRKVAERDARDVSAEEIVGLVVGTPVEPR
jgi:ABC-type sugar transport system ATPase subunit